MSNSDFAEIVLIIGAFAIMLIIGVVATVFFVRQYRIEQREKLAAAAARKANQEK